MDIGKKIQLIRKENGLTQKQLGELTDCATGTIQQYELGKRQPRIEQLKKIANALNVHISVFMDELTEQERINSTLEWIKDNTAKRRFHIIEIMQSHGYTIEQVARGYSIADYQGKRYFVTTTSFDDFVERCDKDIRYDMSKLLEHSREYK